MTSPRPIPRPAIRKGLWFPLSLTVLVLLALPGTVLLALSLAGLEAPANDWLRRHLALSYHNPLPTWAAVILFLVPLLLALLYFLKLRRAALEVPSTFLWRRSIEDLRVNSLFQWLRDKILLLIQLAAVLLLIYSALAFQFHGRSTTSGKHFILLLDSSASMAATDVAPSRLEAARTAALALLEGRPDGDTGMVIEFNSHAAILQPYTRDRALLRAALRRVTQTQRPTRLDDALALAASLANPHRSTDNEAVRPPGEDPAEARTYVAPEGLAAEVHLFSDGRFPDVPGFAAGNLSLIYHRTGAAADLVNNIGIVSLNAVRDEKDPARLQVFVRLLNFRSDPATVPLELEWRQVGRPDFNLREQQLRLPGRQLEPLPSTSSPPPAGPQTSPASRITPGEGAVTFDLDEIDQSADVLLRVRLKDHRDQLALDDEAWLVAGVVRKARVLIVTPGNEVLEHFFRLEETTRVAEVTFLPVQEGAASDSEKYGRPARAGAYDLVVFDRCAPARVEDMPQANTFFIASVPPPWQRREMPPLKSAGIRNPASNHPLMRHLSGLDEIAFSEGFRFDLHDRRVPPQVPRLLEADRDTVLLFVLARRGFRDLVLTFPLVNGRGEWTTNWNLKLSVPVFLRNVLYQLGNVGDTAAEETLQPGQVKVLRPGGSPERVEVAGPGQEAIPVRRGPAGEFVCAGTERVGVYQATWPGGGRAFAVNLLDAEESNLHPREEIRLGEQQIAADQQQRRSYDTWKWLALLALALLLVEWAVYNRVGGLRSLTPGRWGWPGR